MLPYSAVTPKHIYLNRRRFLAAAFALPIPAAAAKLTGAKTRFDAGGEKITPVNIATTYNNYYEFGTGKSEPAKNAPKWHPDAPWTIRIEGEVAQPKALDVDQILKLAPLEERIYRHRCVEAWSIVVPWVGYSLSTLLKQVEPTSKAKYVAFESYWTLGQMPLAQPQLAGIDFPYVEGLRIDEAMHPLALLCVGMYGDSLPNQDGAPVRIVIPWKYGYKSIKSIVKIHLTPSEPPTTWNRAASNEYGFYSNVNPGVDHPRWSQATERRLGEIFKRKTLMFNGYADQVASLYTGMDLKKNY